MSCTNLNWSDDVRYISSYAEKVPETGGIYKFLKDDGEDGKYTRVYVGKAVGLRSQYNFHLSDNEENECLKTNLENNQCYFRYALLSGEDSRKNAEDHLLKDGKYECNIQGQ